MPRIARVVVPNTPHHITQRGNRKQQTFFEPGDYDLYKRLIGEWCRRHGVAVWAYCLMPNHVHLILTPASPDGLARAVGEAHRRYTLMINRRKGWKGYLWQGRFASFPMDSVHLLNAVRYVLLNPVRAGLAPEAAAWPHSSARVHLAQRGDGLVCPTHLEEWVTDWSALLEPDGCGRDVERFRQHQRTGRPMGSEEFVVDLEAKLGRRLRLRSPGRKPLGEKSERPWG